jgi:hypothetical protein
VPEAQALDTLLRSASGYLAAPRPSAVPGASAYDRIFILATSTPSAARAVAAAPQAPPPFTPPVFTAPDEPDDQAPRGPTVPPNRARVPAFNTFPRPAPSQDTPQAEPEPQDAVAPTSDSAPSPTPIVPAGVSTPGMVVPAPQPAGAPPRGGTVIR